MLISRTEVNDRFGFDHPAMNIIERIAYRHPIMLHQRGY